MNAPSNTAVSDAALFEFLTRLGDNALILGHRVSSGAGTRRHLKRTSRFPTPRLI